jgi:hypothetical protein
MISPGKLLAAACAALLPALALAATANTAEVDRELQLLKDETIQLSRELLATERAMLYPERSLTSVYVQVKVSGFLLDSISVRINEAAPQSHTYSNSESLALLKDGGWHRLARLRLEPGTYRLQAEFSGHFFDARPGEAPVKGRVETLFDKGASELDLVLPISRNTRLDKPGLAEISRMDTRRAGGSRNVWMPQPERFEFNADGNRSGGPTDPRYRTALFLRHDSRYLSALVELSDVLATAADPEALPAPFYLLMAECYLAFGMDTRAGALYQKIASGPHDSLTLARARLQLAQFDYQHGRLDGAAERLQAMREKLPSSLREEWRLVMTNVLLAQGKYAETAAMLTEEDSDTPALRYNLAVALIRAGKVAEGREQLDEVGTMDVSNLEQLVLRDKANLTLGYQYLQEQQGPRAREVFGRVRTAGPFSNRALLGLGWSEIAQTPAAKDAEAADAPPPAAAPETPDGTAAGAAPAPVADDSLGTLLRPGYVAPAPGARLAVEGSAAGPSSLPQAEQDALRRALVAWVELVKRDPMDPAVQEGLLAIPWALDRLQAYEQSLTRYLNAISALEDARKRMDEARKSIQGGRMVETIVRRDTDSERGWMWRLRDLPDVPETFFLQSLLAEHRFQESLKSYRDARLLTRHLDAWKKHLADLERGGPAGSIDAQLKHLRRNWQPAWAGTVVWLDLATALSAPGTFDAPATDAPDMPLELRTGPAPASFEGRAERLRPLRVRIDALRPRINAIGSAQDDLLEAISARELEGQRATIERYLTEARFAVARIYDRQQQREAP